MSDKFFTFMIVPERSDKVKKFTLPALYLKIASIVGILLLAFGLFIVFDYLHVLSQVAENKKLRVENHLLRSDLQLAKGKLESLDQSVGRLKSFAQKLRILGNLNMPESSQILSTPTHSAPQSMPGGDEEGGSIDEPDNNSSKGKKTNHGMNSVAPKLPSEPESNARLDYEQSLSKRGELGADFDSQTLLDQARIITASATKLRTEAETEEQSFAELQELFQDRVDRLLHTPSTAPARGEISSEFGYRFNPYSGMKTFHAGIDIANRIGTPVYAPADGVVTSVGVMGGFGQVVKIDHGYDLVSKYGHNSKILVKKGDHVRRGDKISEMGSSGRSTGPHLHYQIEVRGRTVNPRYFILEDIF